MRLYFCPLFSGSSGNCIYVGNDETGVLIDAGVSGSRVEKEMRAIGVSPSVLRAILVTHEHSDHISGVGVLSRRYNLPVYATEGTWAGMRAKLGPMSDDKIVVFDPKEDFYIGDLAVRPFETSHDAAEPCGFLLTCGQASVAIATDLGCIRKSWLQVAQTADVVLLESNYDAAMLDAGPYPYDLKRRIAGRSGHLSNDDAAEAAVTLVRQGVRYIVLGHLSKENNFPELAYQSALSALIQQGLSVGEGGDVELALAPRDGHGPLISLTAD